MKWIIIILVVLAVIVAVALIAVAMKRKKDQAARTRAGELRSDAAATGATTQIQEARAREAQAEADRTKAQADKLEAHADAERTSYDKSRAKQEDHLREADRVDPDVDHKSAGHRPDANGTASHRAAGGAGSDHTRTDGGHPDRPASGSETLTPEEEERARRDQI